MIEIDLTLDQEEKNPDIIETGILQGNSNVQFNVTIEQKTVPVVITADTKPIVFWYYENTGKVYRLTEASPEYANTVSVSAGKIIIKSHTAAVNWYGNVQIVVEIDGLYTYSARYLVDMNPVFTPAVLDVSTDEHALKNLSNVLLENFKAKGIAAGFALSDPKEFEKLLNAANCR
jgi:hypothetical protein